MAKLLSLDLSTSATGYALFEIESGRLVSRGVLKPRVKGITKMKYPEAPLRKIQDLVRQIKEMIDEKEDEIECLLIEEVNKGKNRLGQKVLSSLHFILLDRIQDKIHLVHFKDSDGKKGWRTDLRLFLTQQDKNFNKQIRQKIKRGEVTGDTPINQKHLACRFANKKYDTSLDVDLRPTDADVADAICMAHAFLLTYQHGR